MIILEKLPKMTRQAVLIQDDHMIQALPANGSDHPFHIGALPSDAGADNTCSIPMTSSC
jgi:hypothetical protein